MALTNVGKSEILSWYFRRARPGSNTKGDHGLIVSGSDEALAIILITSAYNFTASAGRPNPDHGTVQQIADSAPGCVLNPATSYTGHIHPLHPDWFDITQDDAGDFGEITFNSAHLPLLSATLALNGIRGYCLAKANNITTARVIDIVQFSAEHNIAQGSQFNITNYGLSLL